MALTQILATIAAVFEPMIVVTAIIFVEKLWREYKWQ